MNKLMTDHARRREREKKRRTTVLKEIRGGDREDDFREKQE